MPTPIFKRPRRNPRWSDPDEMERSPEYYDDPDAEPEEEVELEMNEDL